MIYDSFATLLQSAENAIPFIKKGVEMEGIHEIDLVFAGFSRCCNIARFLNPPWVAAPTFRLQKQTPMAVYYINSYDVTDMDVFKQYPPQVRIILERYGAEVLASDTAAIAVEGKARWMNAIIKFPSEEAALQCYNDPEYEPLRKLRQSSTSNIAMILVKEFKSS
jgi:uncharacterized protein (DUF1330 family)